MTNFRTLALHALPGIPIVSPGDDLGQLICEAIARTGLTLARGDVLVVAQKIVSKSEGRLVRLADVTPSARALELAQVVGKDPRLIELVLQESSEVLRYRQDVIIVEHRLGFIMANAGIDQSNVSGDDTTALLLPIDPDRSCGLLRQQILERTNTTVGIIINDSHGRAWRNGAVGVAIGAAGLPALMNLRGRPDLFGRELHITEVGYADELASAASLLMGQADEGTPVVLISGLPRTGQEGSAADLIRPKHMDMFR